MATRLLLPYGSIATFYHDLSCITLTASKRRWRRWRQRWQLSVIVLLIHSVLSCDSGVGLFVVGSVAAERPLLHQRNFKQRCMLSGSFPRECGMTTSKPHRICLRTYTHCSFRHTGPCDNTQTKLSASLKLLKLIYQYDDHFRRQKLAEVIFSPARWIFVKFGKK